MYKYINKHNKKLLTTVALILMFLLFIVVNFFSNKFFSYARIDLTSNKVFSLSQGSKNVIKNINEPINLKLFFSKQVAKDNPYFFSFALRVEEFLNQYQRYSRDKIVLQVIEPEPFTEQEDHAVHYGLQGVPINNEGTEIYFGLIATNSTTGKEVIPFFQPNRENYLEYDITRLISKLNNTVSNKIAVISSLPIQGEQGFQFMQNKSRPWVIWQQIAQQFDPQILEEGQISIIPEEIKVLLLINTGEPLLLSIAKAIDQFVLRGGHILLLVDPISEIKSTQDKVNTDNNEEKVPLNKLLTAWGVDYDSNKIVASKNNAKQVRYTYEGTETTGLYPLWIDVGADSLAQDDILTNNISKLTFATAGSINVNEQSTAKFTPLVAIKKDGMLINKSDLTKYKANPISLLREYQPQTKPIVLAARITGQVRSMFSDQVTEQSNIVVIANTDFLHDHFWANTQNFLGNQIVIPTSGNGSLILNALDNLSGTNDLIGIRGKDAYAKNFDKIRQLEIISQNRFQQAEESLLKQLEDTKRKLSAMEQQKLSVDHKREEEIFRKKLVETRKQLREVRRSLREDIQVLENKIKFYTIIFMPLLIIIGCLMYWLFGNKVVKLFRHNKL